MPKPIHRQVYDALQRAITDGRYAPGAKLPSEAALVRQFHTSRITVGRALRDLQQQGWIERRAGSGSFVTHRPDGLAFGLLIPELGHTHIFEPICQAIAQSPQSKGFALLWGNAGSPAELCRQFIARKVNGVFFAPVEQASAPGASNHHDLENLQILAAFEQARIPVVLLDRDAVPYPARSRWDLVGIDNRRAGYRITEHLLRAGAQRLKFLAAPNSAPTVAARIAGFREALAAAQTHAASGSGEVIEHPNQLRGADGVVCANDRTAARLIGALAAQGRRVPADIRVGGIDDLPFAALLNPPLTTVAQPCREIGEAALAAMLERVASPGRAPREILLNCELVVRESCGISLVQQ